MKDAIFIHFWKFKSFHIYEELICIFETHPRIQEDIWHHQVAMS